MGLVFWVTIVGDSLKLPKMLAVDIVMIRKKYYHIIINMNLYYELHGHHKIN
jgi:hypothetical protein